jgi:hypothetical protein
MACPRSSSPRGELLIRRSRLSGRTLGRLRAGTMNRLPTALLSVLLALSALVEPTTSAQSQAVSYSREATFSTIRLPYSGLYNLISRIRQLLATANATADRRYEEESLRLQGEASSAGVELPKGFELRDFSAAPNTSYDISYRYRNSVFPRRSPSRPPARWRREPIVEGG